MIRRSGIVGLTDQIQPSLPNLGSIKKGEKTPAGHPKKLSYFRYVPVGKAESDEISPLETLFMDAYGPEPKVIYGMFIGQSEQDVLWTAMRASGKEGKTVRLCDRQTCYSRMAKQGEQVVMERGAYECGYNAAEGKCKFGCKAEGRLTFVLMTPDGTEPLFVNPNGYPVGTVSHKLSETDLKDVLGSLRGALLMAPLMGMVAKLSLREWKHPQFGTIYATSFMFAGIYHQFQRPALAAPSTPIVDIPDDGDEEDAFDNFGVDEHDVETPKRPDIGTSVQATPEQYAWAWKNYLLLPTEFDWILDDAANPFDQLAMKNACYAFANQLVQWNNPEWIKALWEPFLEKIGRSKEEADAIVTRAVGPEEIRLLEYRKAVVQ